MALRSVGKFVAKSFAMRPRMASPAPQTRVLSEGELDFSALGATVLRKKWSILRPTILVALVTLLAVQVITSKYQSESRSSARNCTSCSLVAAAWFLS
jgi:hypothetical protein